MSAQAQQPVTDFDRYLASDDAQQAEPWQLVTMSALRRAIGRDLSQAEYAEMRAELHEKFGSRERRA